MKERQWNPHVKATLAELRQYALTNNEDFKDGFVDGYEVTKTYYHTDPRLLGSRNVDFERDIQTTEFMFSAFRQPEHINGRATYIYSLGALVTRSIDTLEPYLEMQLNKSMREELQDLNPGDLTESFCLQFKAKDLKPNDIASKTSYSVELYSEPIHETEEQDFQLEHTENFVDVPDLRFKRKTKKVFVPATIEHEQYPLELPRLLNDAAFEAIVGSLNSKKEMRSIDTIDAAQRMSTILAKLRTGRIE
jgi:hypothetical protein